MKIVDLDVVLKACKHQQSKYVPDTAGYRTAESIIRYIEKEATKASIDQAEEEYAGFRTDQYGIACTGCGHYMGWRTPYCYHCGAKMKGWKKS